MNNEKRRVRDLKKTINSDFEKATTITTSDGRAK